MPENSISCRKTPYIVSENYLSSPLRGRMMALMTEKMTTKQTRAAIDACLTSAEASLAMAERELGNGADHLCFHLALLALEEIGKSILLSIGYVSLAGGKDKPALETALDDHVKKIFWALWQGLLSRKGSPVKEIQEMQGMATLLHEKRLSYLYTDPSNPTLDPKDKIQEGEAKRLIDLARARLEIEKQKTGIEEFEQQELEELTWFFQATENKETRAEIFASYSMGKLAELGSGRAWIKWLYSENKKRREEMLRLTEQEISRKKPATDEEAEKPKYKMRLRIQSHSHHIRDNAFDEWNKGVRDTKIYKTNSKNLPIYAKSELVIEFIFSKTIAPGSLWDAGFSIAKTFVNAINIATMGLFWWNMPKDVEKYYDEIVDLEADPSGKILLSITPEKRLMINWGEDDRRTIKKEDVSQISMVSGFLLYQNELLKEFLIAYAMGMTLLAKTDIHLRLEANAYEEFFKAFKAALIALGDWDGIGDLREAVKLNWPGLSLPDHLVEHLQMGLDLDPAHSKPHNITLTEIIGMKIYCDAYIILKAQEYFQKMSEEAKSSEDPTSQESEA